MKYGQQPPKQYAPPFDDPEDNLNFIELIEYGAIVTQPFLPGTKFDITNPMT